MRFPDEDLDMMSIPGCDHRELSAAELADSVPPSYIRQWSSLAQTGWNIFCLVLHRSEKEWEVSENPLDVNLGCPHLYGSGFGSDKSLRILCSAVQTEALTYRRLKEGDPWMSSNFDMDSLLDGLREGNEVCVDLVENDMMNLCKCGDFKKVPHHKSAPTRAEKITKYHFSNLDDRPRSTYIEDYGLDFM
ncbi:hypothetical protein MMC18_008940 [Xylographa bjoerkii]|nr:hypothetical protein [Xylographa bjoerkii]